MARRQGHAGGSYENQATLADRVATVKIKCVRPDTIGDELIAPARWSHRAPHVQSPRATELEIGRSEIAFRGKLRDKTLGADIATDAVVK
jgi:hypothetical protein